MDKKFFNIYNYETKTRAKEALRSANAERERIKKIYLEAIKKFYEESRSSDPNFKLSLKNLDTYIKNNKEIFLGLNSAGSVLQYFNCMISSLEIALGIKSV